VFRKGSGSTLISFLHDARIDAARRYLETTDFSVKEIAGRCGFENGESLRRLFTRRLEIGPVEYRARFRSADGGKRPATETKTGRAPQWQQ
jgi:transcriptional regulator GlxA family with amidase domain